MNHDDFFKIKTTNKNYVLLTTTSPVKNIVHGLLVKTQIQYENTIRSICQTTKKLNKKLIIKLHPDFKEIDILKIVKEIDKNITVLKTGNTLDLIASCEVMIAIDLSTTILEAQILKKPVITMHVKDYGYGTHEIFDSSYSLLIDVKEYENYLTKILTDTAFKNNLISMQSGYIEKYFSNCGTSTENIFNYLLKL